VDDARNARKMYQANLTPETTQRKTKNIPEWRCKNHKNDKRVWKLPTPTNLRATWHAGSLDMVVLPFTGASRYHSCCIDGGTSLEYFGYPLIRYVFVHWNCFKHFVCFCSLYTEFEGELDVPSMATKKCHVRLLRVNLLFGSCASVSLL
jgi:hypothetical protein